MPQGATKSSTIPDGGYGWVIVFSSFMLSWLVDGMLYAYGVMKIALQDAFQASEVSTMLVGSLCVGVYMLLGPVYSKLTERFGFRNSIIGGSIVTSFFMILSTMANSIYVLMITYGIGAGFGYGLVYLASLGVLNVYFDEKLNLVIGIVASGTGVGVLSFGVISGYLFDLYGWRGGLLVLAAIMMNGVVFGALMRPLDTEERHPTETKITNVDTFTSLQKVDYKPLPTDDPSKVVIETPCAVEPVRASKRNWWTNLKAKIRCDLILDPPMLLLCLGQVFGMFGYYLIVLLLVSVTEREIKATPFQSRMTMTVFGIANTIARVVFGWLANQNGMSALLVSNITLSICALLAFLFLWVTTYAHVMIFSLAFGIFSAPYVGLTISCLKEILRKDDIVRRTGWLMISNGLRLKIL
ncbi:hypothetical protein ACOME3_010232 [Neoechinorhynchus agilis]